MVSIPATTAEDYLAQLPDDRRPVVEAVRRMVKRHLPEGYEERALWGMICYSVPLEKSGPTYNGQGLCYAAIAAQKHHYALYLMGPYGDPRLRQQLEDVFARAGKRLDMGKSCMRFKTLDAIPLEELGPIVAAVPMDRFIAFNQAVHAKTKTGAKRAAKAGAKKATSARVGKAPTAARRKATKTARRK